MMPVSLSQRLARVAQKFLAHKCTLVGQVTVLDGSGHPVVDDEGHDTYTTIEETNVDCLMLWKDIEVTDERGTVTVHVPQVYFSNEIDLTNDVVVKDVQTKGGVSLLKSGKINTIDTTAEGGEAVMYVATLEGATM